MKILPISEQYINQIAVLHKKEFPFYHFTSRFPISLLENYFRYLIKFQEFSHLALAENGMVIGYLIGGSHSVQAVYRFQKDFRFGVSLVLLKNPSFIYEKIKNILNRKTKVSSDEKIYSNYVMCVDPKAKGSPGLVLIRHFEKKLIENNIKEYYCSVRPSNKKVMQMYDAMEFLKIKQNKTTVLYKKILY
jgi:ribosomal protein S18 acetylase RimI-like enzyme